MTKTKFLALLTALLLFPGCAAAAEEGQAVHAAAWSRLAPSSGGQTVAQRLEERAQQRQAEAEAAALAAEQAAAEAAAAEEAARAEAWALADHVYSHRGASGYEVEHTFASYDLAIELGSHNIEQDLVTSADGTLYVSHDESAARIAGVDRSFSDMSDEEIAQLRTSNGEGIHTMAEVFERYGKDVTYLVELKEGQEQARAFAGLVRKYGMEENVILQSFYPSALEALEGDFPDMPKLSLCREQDAVNRAVEASYADIVCVKGPLMTESNVKKVHDAGKKFCVYWTDGEAVKTAIQMGADCYFTNYTDTALELEREYRGK